MAELKDDLLCGAKAAADYCGLGQRQIYHMVEAGLLPHRQMGRLLFFRKSELDKAFRSDNG